MSTARATPCAPRTHRATKSTKSTSALRRSHSRTWATPSTSSPSSASDARRDATLERMRVAGTPFAIDASDMCDDVAYASDVSRARGARDLHALCKTWLERVERDLREPECTIENVGNTGPNEYVVRWSVEFVPEKMKWLYDTALNWPFGELRITKYDVLDRIGDVSRFTYRALFQLFKRALLEKEMRIPIARIEGTSRLTFDAFGKLASHTESLSLVAAINDAKCRNKRICRDLLEYLDARKPPGVSLEKWDIQVEDNVDIYSVPGMRQLDVDGLEDQAGNIEDATAVLGFFTLVFISFGFGFGAWYLHGIQQEAAIRRMLETGAY